MDNITLTFTQQEMSVIDQALQQLPFYQVAPIFNAINEQLKAQSEKPNENQQ